MSKKVIEQVGIVNRNLTIEINEDNKAILTQSNDLSHDEVVVCNQHRTTVAKAIDPEYQKVIDQNAKLVEALEGLLVGVEVFCKTIPAKMTSEAIHLWTKRRDGIEALQNTKNIEG